ncbi:MAG: TRAP transporter small permease [Desulfovibrionaceae bacterium]|nr:TRAP transporter small permease [Desulfovibrionaceae bacterium]
MKFFLERSGRVLRLASLALAGAGGCIFLVMLGVICANIILRPLDGGIRGALELSGYLCALAVGLCMPAAQLAGSHIAAGLWVSALPRLARQIQRILCGLFCAFLLGAAGNEILGVAAYAHDMGEYIDGFDFSYAFMALGLASGLFLQSIIFIHETLCALFLPADSSGGAQGREA